MTVDLFIPCCLDQFFPEKVDNIIQILDELSVDVSYNSEQTCCGQLSYKLGKRDEARELAEKFVTMYSGNLDLVVPSPSCVKMIRQNYVDFFYNTSFHLSLKSLQSRTYDIHEFLLNRIKVEHWPGKFSAKAYFLDSKTFLKNNGLMVDPCDLLRMIDGLEIDAYSSDEECCGFGGNFIFQFPDISTKNCLGKLNEIVQTGAEYVITTEASNILNLQNLAKFNNINLKFATVTDILAMSLEN